MKSVIELKRLKEIDFLDLFDIKEGPCWLIISKKSRSIQYYISKICNIPNKYHELRFILKNIYKDLDKFNKNTEDKEIKNKINKYLLKQKLEKYLLNKKTEKRSKI